ncbi:hypothetical protein KC723_00155 [Candidatus Kaiserbacteria bacterium]|nr:hypothetical protein [Candidatus Kaiserbacteria bacterium]
MISTPQQRQEMYNQAPEHIQVLYGSMETAEFIGGLIQKHELSEVSQGELVIIIGECILDLFPESELAEQLTNAGIDADTANQLAVETAPLLAKKSDTSLKWQDDDEAEEEENLESDFTEVEVTAAPVIKQDLWSKYLEATDATTKEMLFSEITNQAKQGTEMNISATWKTIHDSIENNSWYQGNALPVIRNTYTDTETNVPSIIAGIHGSASGDANESAVALQHTIMQYNSLPEPIQQMIYYGSITETISQIATACKATAKAKNIENEVVLILLLLAPRSELENKLTTKYGLSAENANIATYLIDTNILIPVFKQLKTEPVAPTVTKEPAVNTDNQLPSVRTMRADKAIYGYQNTEEESYSATSQDDLIK